MIDGVHALPADDARSTSRSTSSPGCRSTWTLLWVIPLIVADPRRAGRRAVDARRRRCRSTSATSQNFLPYFLRVWLYISPVLYYAARGAATLQVAAGRQPARRAARPRGATCSTLGIAPPTGHARGRRRLGVRDLHRRRRCSSSPGSVSSLSVSEPRQHPRRGRLGDLPHVARAQPTLKRRCCGSAAASASCARSRRSRTSPSRSTTAQVLGVVGANGAGKSTLMRTIAGILPPTVGPRRGPRPREHAAGARRRLQPQADRARERRARRPAPRACTRDAARRRSTRRSSSSPSSRTSWTCRCGPTRRACTAASRSPWRSTWTRTSC